MTCKFEAQSLICFVTSIGGIVFSTIATICSLTNTKTDSSLRYILVSFSIANIVGTCMFTYDTVANMCDHLKESADFLVLITMSLSLLHIMLLTLNYYLIEKKTKRKARDNLGLILTAWIISAALGSMTSQHDSKYQPGLKIFLIVIFILCIFSTIRLYSIIKKIREHNEKLDKWYESFLHIPGVKPPSDKSQWRRRFLALVMFTYLLCFVPWVVNEIRQVALGVHSSYSTVHSVTVFIYVLNFYVPSVLCMYTSYKGCLQRRRRKQVESDGILRKGKCSTPVSSPLL